MPEETDQPLHDQGGIHIRQYDQQQGAVFCVRTGGRDRAQPDIERTKEALARRKAEGVVLGRRKGSFTKLNVLVENRLAVIRMLDEDRSVAQICRRYDLSRDTFDRFRRQCPSVREAFERKEARRAARFAVRSL